MPKTKAVASFSDVCRRVWGDCFSLWPLYPAYAVFLFLQFAAFFLCLLVVFFPFFKDLGPQASRVEGLDPGLEQIEMFLTAFFQWMMEPSRLLLVFGMATLYSTWMMLLFALFDGGVFRCFLDHSGKGAGYSTGKFLRDGFQVLGQMILLQFFLFLILSAGLMVLGLGAWVLVLVVSLEGLGPLAKLVLGLLLGLPLLAAFCSFLLLLVPYSFTAKACVAKGTPALESLREALALSRANGGRSVKGILLVFLLYLGLSVALSLFFNLLSIIPFLGVLFNLADFLTGALLAVFIGVFVPGLSVHYLGEGGRKG